MSPNAPGGLERIGSIGAAQPGIASTPPGFAVRLDACVCERIEIGQRKQAQPSPLLPIGCKTRSFA
jgi:hypothetical protein